MSLVLPFRGVLPRIDESAFVAENATVIGDLDIGAESSIWFGVIVRADVMPIRIGARTSIQDNSVVHATGGWVPTEIEDDVTVGHAVILHGCRIRSRVLIGMGCIVMDDAEIGSDTVLGAGSLVTQGLEIPSGVLALGRPAKPIRDLTASEHERISQASKNYVEYGGEYRRAQMPG